MLNYAKAAEGLGELDEEIQMIVLYFGLRKTIARRKTHAIGLGHVRESENTR